MPNTHSYYKLYLDFEQYFTFHENALQTLLMTIGGMLIVILVITADLVATGVVAISVGMS